MLLSNKLSLVLAYSLVIVVAVGSNYPLVWGQFVGEDEVSQLCYSSGILDNLRHFKFPQSIRFIGGALLGVPHPPLRYLLCLPGIFLFPDTEFGLRLVSILLSLYMTWQAMRLGKELGGCVVGLATGLLLGSSSVYNWTSMGFAWSLIACMLIHSIRLLNSRPLDLMTDEGRAAYVRINVFILIAFLVNTSCILFYVSTLAIFGMMDRRRRSVLIRASAPFLLFYLLYYLVVLVIAPYLFHLRSGEAGLAGQFAQTLSRAHGALTCRSLLENLKGLNAYFLPFVSWVVLAFSLCSIVRRNRMILYWLLPFLVMWSFFLRGNTQSYFLLVFIAILPFGVAYLFAWWGRKPALAMCLALSLCAVAWNYRLFWHAYTELGYPYQLLRFGYAQADRKHNVIQPYEQIGEDIDGLLGKNERFIHDLSGCFSMFYYKDDPTRMHHSRYSGLLGGPLFPLRHSATSQCYEFHPPLPDPIRIAVSERELCPGRAKLHRTYPGSRIKLYLLD